MSMSCMWAGALKIVARGKVPRLGSYRSRLAGSLICPYFNRGGDKNLGADMTPRTVFATLLVAFAIASICAGLTTARQLHEQALNARIISRG
jgi:hypothetical protein